MSFNEAWSSLMAKSGLAIPEPDPAQIGFGVTVLWEEAPSKVWAFKEAQQGSPDLFKILSYTSATGYNEEMTDAT